MNINSAMADIASDEATIELLENAINSILAFKTFEASNAVLRGHLRQFLNGTNTRRPIDADLYEIEGTAGPEIEAAYKIPSFKMRKLTLDEIATMVHLIRDYIQSPCENWAMKVTRNEAFKRQMQSIGLKKATLVNELTPEKRMLFIDYVNFCAQQRGNTPIAL